MSEIVNQDINSEIQIGNLVELAIISNNYNIPPKTNIKQWFEHFFIIPFRWLKIHWQNWFCLQQRCKVCGCRDKFDFHVSDNVWEEIVPDKYKNRVVCLACFDDFASKKEIDYSSSIECLYFSGNNTSIQFK